MAYAQWVSFNMKTSGFSANVQNASLDWGKFYHYDDKDQEVSSGDVDKIALTGGRNYPNVIAS